MASRLQGVHRDKLRLNHLLELVNFRSEGCDFGIGRGRHLRRILAPPVDNLRHFALMVGENGDDRDHQHHDRDADGDGLGKVSEHGERVHRRDHCTTIVDRALGRLGP